MSAAGAWAGAARGRFLDRSLSQETALRSPNLGGGDEARAALASLHTTPEPILGYDGAVEPIGFTRNVERDEIPIPERLLQAQGPAR